MSKKIFTQIAVAMLAVVASLPAMAMAATGDGYKAPEIEPSIPWMSVLYSVVAVIGVCAAGFLNARRTHLD